ncbi:hypothetical protein GN958_ATG20890 [Phytophthora infestans]|uniref:Uncharacterized protein n=1 Tax=Phytophthora infestans TaxID=4787 RepID=A0A8S9TSH1_PHYIN|nr:hypothetical protein GN958_ATG20890 [Phytophthora infestans]
MSYLPEPQPRICMVVNAQQPVTIVNRNALSRSFWFFASQRLALYIVRLHPIDKSILENETSAVVAEVVDVVRWLIVVVADV